MIQPGRRRSYDKIIILCKNPGRAKSFSREVLTLYLLVGEVCIILGFATFDGSPPQTFIVRILLHALLEQLIQSTYAVQGWPAIPTCLVPVDKVKKMSKTVDDNAAFPVALWDIEAVCSSAY